jgi:hypothetical protein
LKRHSRDLEDANRQLRNGIKQILSRDFNDQLKHAELSSKNSNMVDTMIHEQLAEMINDLLKAYD